MGLAGQTKEHHNFDLHVYSHSQITILLAHDPL